MFPLKNLSLLSLSLSLIPLFVLQWSANSCILTFIVSRNDNLNSLNSNPATFFKALILKTTSRLILKTTSRSCSFVEYNQIEEFHK